MVSEFFKFKNIDRLRNKLVTIKIEDKDGSEVSLEDIISKVKEYILKNIRDTNPNTLTQTVYPLLSQAMANTIVESVGDEMTGIFLLSQSLTRNAIIQQMMIGHYIMKYIHLNELQIVTIETDLSQEEIDKLLTNDKIGQYDVLAAASGYTPKETAEALLNSGTVTKDDLRSSNIFSEEEINSTGSTKSTKKNEFN